MDNEEVRKPQDAGFKPVDRFQLRYSQLEVFAQVDEEVTDVLGKTSKIQVEKHILKSCSGMFSPNTFTAIVGPSGCGKTTLLNLLSGRLLSTNLRLKGKLYVNSKETTDMNIYGEKIGYVMQEDLLMATFTPRQTFRFIANLRLITLSQEQKEQKVEEIIKVLGLSKCADTYIGNNLIRGISGGEKKRTSIGVELLINPSILFLDEPTTGLDSTTALHVMSFLKELAQSGRTVISTIHQPSSQIFSEFDRLQIMVQGNIVYQGSATGSMDYFKRIGFPIPNHSNPTDYYMKIMNKQGLIMDYIEQNKPYTEQQVKTEFEQRLKHFIDSYNGQKPIFRTTETEELVRNTEQGYLPFIGQFYYIFVRAFKNQLRNPLDVQLRMVQMVIQAVICICLYYQTGDTNPFNAIQNTSGALFLFVSVCTMGGISSNLSTFANERPIFIRQRMSNSYSTSAYYWGRSCAMLPFQILMPILFVCICYFKSGLNNDVTVFFWTVLILELICWNASSYGLLVSTLIEDLNVAMGLISLLIIPLMLASGFFTNLNDVPKVFYIIEYISMFKYGFQALLQNQFRTEINCGPPLGQCNILDTKFKFNEPFWLNLFLLFSIGLLMRALAYYAMYYISNPKRVSMANSEYNKTERELISVKDLKEGVIEVGMEQNMFAI